MTRIYEYTQELPRIFEESINKKYNLKINKALKTIIILDDNLKNLLLLIKYLFKNLNINTNLEFILLNDFSKKSIKNLNLVFIGNSKKIVDLAKYYKHLNPFVITTNEFIIKESIRNTIKYHVFEFPLTYEYPFETILFIFKLIDELIGFDFNLNKRLLDIAFSLRKYDFEKLSNIVNKIDINKLMIVFTDSIIIKDIRNIFLINKIPLFLEEYSSKIFIALPDENYFIIYDETSFIEMKKYKQIIDTIKGIIKINLGKSDLFKREVLIYVLFINVLKRIIIEKTSNHNN